LLEPIRERRAAVAADPDGALAILRLGTKRARATVKSVVEDVRAVFALEPLNGPS
jgi:hypothetical protein